MIDPAFFQFTPDFTGYVANMYEQTSFTLIKGRNDKIIFTLEMWNKFKEKFQLIDMAMQNRSYIHYDKSKSPEESEGGFSAD